MLKNADPIRKAIRKAIISPLKQDLLAGKNIKMTAILCTPEDSLAGKMVNSIMGPSTQDLLTGNKIQIISIHEYIDV